MKTLLGNRLSRLIAIASSAALFALPACGDDDSSETNNGDQLVPNNGTNNATNNVNNATNNGTNNGNTNNGSNNGKTNNGQQEPDPNSVTLPDPAEFDFSSEAVFSLDGLQADLSGNQEGDVDIVCKTDCEDNMLIDGSVTLYPLDLGWGWDTIDFVGATNKPQDGVFDDGWAGEILDTEGNAIGVAIATIPTQTYKTGPQLGAWCSGVSPSPAKCITEHRATAEHVLTCYESVPYHYMDWLTGEPTSSDYDNCPPLLDNFDRPLAELTPYTYDLTNLSRADQFSVRMGDHPGEYKMMWGDTDKRPEDVRIVTRIPVPDEFKTGGPFKITRAELAVVHTITNNPNDQVRPEDLSNEGAMGLEPGYTVDSEGRWLSDRDCIEGDGDVIPAGTVFKNPAYADPNGWTPDRPGGFTAAWYTTIDRDPFMWGLNTGPRWRLKAPKFGQDLPALEIPTEFCATYPLKKDEKKYERGDITVTHLNLLDVEEGLISQFALSTGYTTPNPDEIMPGEIDLTNEGTRLSEDLDLVVYIKGDRNAVRLYKAVLYLDYEPVD